MSRTISTPGVPPWLLQPLAAGFAVFLVLFHAVQVVLLLVPGVDADVLDSPAVLAGLVAVWFATTGLWVRWARRRDGEGSWWGPVPDWQYGGRFAGHGGLARDAWERALPNARDDDE